VPGSVFTPCSLGSTFGAKSKPNLRWEWEIPIPEPDTSVFLIPGQKVKNREDRLVILNTTTRSAVESLRGVHPELVTDQGHAVHSINNTAWQSARRRVGLPWARVHDL